MLNFTINKYYINKSFIRNFQKISFKSFYFQEPKHGAGDVIILFLINQPHIVAKRVIKVVGQRLRE